MRNFSIVKRYIGVLIVPCGIEIKGRKKVGFTDRVLIVPCGIEIAFLRGLMQARYCLNRTMWN